MNITTWRRRERRISDWGVHDFYDRSISEVYLFDFVTSRLELPPHGGSFSIKFALAGEEEYFIGRRTLRVRPGSFLPINGGEIYGSRIRSPTHSLSLFYPDRDVAAAQASLFDDGRCALVSEEIAPHLPGMPQFSSRLSARSHRGIADLRVALRLRRREAAEEAAATLLLAVLRDHSGSAPRLCLDKVRKPATRDELLGRIVRAREYIADMRGMDCSLDRLAQVACLSKFHFLRLFQQVFSTGPAACARVARLEEARRTIACGQSEDFAAAASGYASRHSLRRALGLTSRRHPTN
jgi:AraC family transcriptional regulator